MRDLAPQPTVESHGPRLTTATALRLAGLVVLLRVVGGVLYEYPRYAPPDFHADFLLGREPHFWGPYAWAFYAHLLSGPLTLLLGTLLLSERFRRGAPAWHRRLGRIQVATILLLLTPSGLWMARYAHTGWCAGVGLGLLALLTTGCTWFGWRAARARRYADHRRWMERCFVLLCSAVVIRLLGGLATFGEYEAEWVYPASVWLSWLGPLAAYEAWRLRRREEKGRVGLA